VPSLPPPFNEPALMRGRGRAPATDRPFLLGRLFSRTRAPSRLLVQA
jgi:hypothetical protein